jgi:diguanylate cyclase (GGDEF)-like protein
MNLFSLRSGFTHSQYVARIRNVMRVSWLTVSGLRTPAIVNAGWPMLVIAVVGVVVALFQLRESSLDDARRNIANLALILSEQTARSVQSIDLVLREIEEVIPELNADDPVRFESVVGGYPFREMLREKRGRITQADLVSIVSNRGRLLNTSRDESRIGLDLSDRDYYRHLSTTVDRALFVSAPVQDKADGLWTIFLGRRLNAKDGSFLGIVLAGVRISYFEEIYNKIDLPHGESFLLLRNDGTVLVRHPDRNRRAGQTMPKDSPWYDLVAKNGGFYTSPGYFDGIPRMVAVRPLGEFPLVMNASVSETSVLATWRRQALARGSAAALILGYAALLMYLSRRQFNSLKLSRTSLKQRNADLLRLSEELDASRTVLSQNTTQLKTILDTMDQGLLMVDGQGVVVHCNERARELLNLPAGFAASKPTFLDVLAYQWETNRSGRDEGSFDEFILKRTTKEVSHIQEIVRPDGRVLEVRGVAMPSGGFVRTYTDITNRKRAEDRVRYLAQHDDLTRLPNRVSFRERLHDALTMARNTRRGVALLYLDLDRFKQINDNLGHDAGDTVLQEAAQRMRSVVRAIDTVARLGGDEFAMILPFLEETGTAEELSMRVIASFGRSFEICGVKCELGISIGIALFPQDASSAEELIRSADAALYEAKRAGRNTYRLAKPPEHQKLRTAT